MEKGFAAGAAKPFVCGNSYTEVFTLLADKPEKTLPKKQVK